MNSLLIWSLSLISILCMLCRPRNIAEVIWIAGGAFLLVLFQLISLKDAFHAISAGLDVYLFLMGMMLLAELAKREGVFEWLAGIAVDHAQGSAQRLFLLIYTVGILVTVFLSNDATAVVLTPAIFAAVKRAKAHPLPYLFACAFIANAASFVLPISNPANLVIFGKHMPPLLEWLKIFTLPSLLSIGATYFVLRWISRKELRSKITENLEKNHLSTTGRIAAFGLIFFGIVLTFASALNWDLGLPTLIAALIVVGTVTIKDRRAPQVFLHVSWSVLPLVAGLFIIVEAINHAGALHAIQNILRSYADLPPLLGRLAAAFGTGLASNIMNNLPVGLISGMALQRDGISPSITHSVLIGVDLGPNLSVTGSLATVLWLIALRREGMNVSAWEFLKAGILVMPIALFLSVAFLNS